METATRDLFFELLRIASPTGSEQPLQRKIYEHYKEFADYIDRDVHGNMILGCNTKAKRKILLAGHCDQIGFLVKYISPDGYIFLDPVGGIDRGVIMGAHMDIHTKTGPVRGVMGRKPKHMQETKESTEIPDQTKLWLDIGAKDEANVKEKVALGDYVTFALGVTELTNDLISAPGLDNKAGLFACLEALRECATSGCDVALYVASTVQEEIGSRGASTATNKLSPDVGIAVDVIPATDDPGCDLPPQKVTPTKLRYGPTISTGPNTNPVVGKMLLDVAEKLDLPCQDDPSGSTAPNDAKVIQMADSGVAAASVGIPERNMHTQVEIVSLKDIEDTIKLLVGFIKSVKEDTDFRPFFFNE